MRNENKLLMVFIALFIAFVATVAVNAQDPYAYDWTEEDAEALAFLGLGLLCIPAAWFIIAILIAIWVYRDAERRGSSGVLWLVIVFFTGIIGLIIWLVVRAPIGGNQPVSTGTTPPPAAPGTERRCPNCGRVIPDDARVCPYCGKNFEG